jgi:predicted 3-demethylubiquinone-9 3-methyltransferase (glyoxalase superfamily)
MQKITPFLWFDKNAEEAMNFYISIFKNARIISIARYPEGPLEGPMKGMEGKVLTAVFELEGQRFMAIDGGPALKPSGAISFYVECETQDEVDHYWNSLAAGGDPQRQECGWLQDKFGFSWQIIPKALPRLLTDPDKAKSARVLQVMLQMKKIVVADLEKAAQG